jgi:hypothetical protein
MPMLTSQESRQRLYPSMWFDAPVAQAGYTHRFSCTASVTPTRPRLMILTKSMGSGRWWSARVYIGSCHHIAHQMQKAPGPVQWHEPQPGPQKTAIARQIGIRNGYSSRVTGQATTCKWRMRLKHWRQTLGSLKTWPNSSSDLAVKEGMHM